jgi:CDGSH-type Zn-finger protein
LVGDVKTYSWGISVIGNHTLHYLGNQKTALIKKCGSSEKIPFYAGTDILGWL